MARRPRLVLPGQAHYVIQRGHSERALFSNPNDRANFFGILNEAAHSEGVLLHAFALLETEVHLLATPSSATALARWVQAVGRRYVSAYNRRNGQSGTLWAGRFRACVVEPGATRLAALRLIDGLAVDPQHSSAPHHLGTAALLGVPVALHDVPELWALGNTPFEREASYGKLLRQGLTAATADKLRSAALGGWVAGSSAFVAEIEQSSGLAARPRPRGRPSRPP